MSHLDRATLLAAGVQYGHLSKRWSPDFKPFLFGKKEKRHIINVDATIRQLEAAGKAMKKIAQAGKKILFVSCKKQAKVIMKATAEKLGQPYITEQWPGGLLTNFATIKRLVKKLIRMTEGKNNPHYIHSTKKEKLILERKRKKLERVLQGIAALNQLPAALFVVDVNREHTAIREANKLKIPVFAIVDSNASFARVDYPIPGNDDKGSAISLLVNYVEEKIAEGNAIWEKEKGSKNRTVSSFSHREVKRRPTTTPAQDKVTNKMASAKAVTQKEKQPAKVATTTTKPASAKQGSSTTVAEDKAANKTASADAATQKEKEPGKVDTTTTKPLSSEKGSSTTVAKDKTANKVVSTDAATQKEKEQPGKVDTTTTKPFSAKKVSSTTSAKDKAANKTTAAQAATEKTNAKSNTPAEATSAQQKTDKVTK